jgi:hypothetical protein
MRLDPLHATNGIGTVGSGNRVSPVQMCADSCPVANVSVYGMPEGSFDGLSDPTLATEPASLGDAITWKDDNLDQGISFYYVRPPFQHMKELLRPLIGVSSLGGAALAIFGVLIGIGSLIVEWVVVDMMKERFDRLRGRGIHEGRLLRLRSEPWLPTWEADGEDQLE